MKLQDVKEIARRLNVPSTGKKADLIRSIQQAEGNQQCYSSGIADRCGQSQCCWREDCR